MAERVPVAGTDVEEAHVPAAGTVVTAERASAAGANAAAELSPLSRGADNAGHAPATEVDTAAERALPEGADTGVERALSPKGVATREGVGEGDFWAESTPVLGHLDWGRGAPPPLVVWCSVWVRGGTVRPNCTPLVSEVKKAHCPPMSSSASTRGAAASGGRASGRAAWACLETRRHGGC